MKGSEEAMDSDESSDWESSSSDEDEDEKEDDRRVYTTKLGRNWNAEFQDIMREPPSPSKFLKLSTLAHDISFISIFFIFFFVFFLVFLFFYFLCFSFLFFFLIPKTSLTHVHFVFAAGVYL